MKMMLSLVALLILSCALALAQESPESGPDSLRRIDDYLWLVRSPDEARMSPELGAIREKLKGSKVPDIDEAVSVALGHKLEKCGGVLAEEQGYVVGLLRIGIDLPAVARKGDFAWVVRFSHLNRGVTQEVWVGSSSGQAKCLLPFG